MRHSIPSAFSDALLILDMYYSNKGSSASSSASERGGSRFRPAGESLAEEENESPATTKQYVFHLLRIVQSINLLTRHLLLDVDLL